MPHPPRAEFDPDGIVDQLYDIALDPQSLDRFIDAWNSAGLDSGAARRAVDGIDRFDAAYRAHLDRAETFLARGGDGEQAPDLSGMLAPFDALAAFVVDRRMRVVATNDGARAAFGLTQGGDLGDLNLPGDARDTLTDAVSDVLATPDRPDRLLRLQFSGARGPALFQMRCLPDSGGARHVLVVTTQYHWQAALGQTLEDVFALTLAEQSVVRAMVEGRDAKAIAADRGTSEGTVRGQIKSILSKMNARTQSEVIRLVLSLRDISGGVSSAADAGQSAPTGLASDWLTAEVWKPFKRLTLPDGRRLDYHDMGPVTGAPVIYSHMGYGQARWHGPMLRLAFTHGLRIIVPIRAGYGQSDNLDPAADVLQATRDDTRHLMDHLGIARLPYVTQGNDLIFAVDFAAHHPDRVSELIGLCARPCLPGDLHYAGMGKWHRFFLSTAKHAPHLLKFTAKAAVSMAKRIGVTEMYRQMNQSSPADLALIKDDDLRPVLIANAELIAGKSTNVAQAYAMELLATESDWAPLIEACRDIPTWFVNGAEDPSTDLATIAVYRETYPWIDIEVVQNAGQMLIYQHYKALIPRIAAAARAV